MNTISQKQAAKRSSHTREPSLKIISEKFAPGIGYKNIKYVTRLSLHTLHLNILNLFLKIHTKFIYILSLANVSSSASLIRNEYDIGKISRQALNSYARTVA